MQVKSIANQLGTVIVPNLTPADSAGSDESTSNQESDTTSQSSAGPSTTFQLCE